MDEKTGDEQLTGPAKTGATLHGYPVVYVDTPESENTTLFLPSGGIGFGGLFVKQEANMGKTQELTGPALAAEVAVKVMGWKIETHLEGKFYIVEGNWWRFADFRPDLDIAQAWEVVEKMRTLGFSMWVGPNPDEFGGGWEVQEKPFTQNLHEFVHAETAPLAICRAALAAVGVK